MFYLFLIIGVLNLDVISSQTTNSKWPEDDSKPFPYPTRDPINVISSAARNLKTPTPITFYSDIAQLAIATNTGSNLLIVPKDNEDNEKAVITGGVLYNDTYKFFQTEYFWDLKLKNDAAVKIDYVGSPVQVVVSYFNTKYGSKNRAMVKRDGIAQFVLFVYVTPFTNFAFYPFQFQLKPIIKAGTSTTINEYESYAWYFQRSSRDDYYAYPGQYIDQETGKTYYSSIVIVLVREPQPFISTAQFNATFGAFKNSARQSYSHTSKIVPRGRRPIVHANGLVMGTVE